MTDQQQLILAALSHQAPGYLAAPNASCFVQFRLDARSVQNDLVELARVDPPLAQLSYVTEDVYQDVADDDGVLTEVLVDTVVVDVGWELTDAGRARAATVQVTIDDVVLGGAA